MIEEISSCYESVALQIPTSSSPQRKGMNAFKNYCSCLIKCLRGRDLQLPYGMPKRKRSAVYCETIARRTNFSMIWPLLTELIAKPRKWQNEVLMRGSENVG